MKVLRAIGAFFAKIGRWIANTAWVQPLLIVGGIFAVIFSIPYIKKGIEGLQADNTDYKYAYYQDRSLSLTDDGRADKLLGYLEDYEHNVENIRKEFGSKFFLTFAQKSCTGCKDQVEGYNYFNKHNSSTDKFKLYSILVDKTDSKGNYLAKDLVIEHIDLFNEIEGAFADESENYPLFRNKESVKSTMISKIRELSNCTDVGEGSKGIETPTTLMIDLDGFEDGQYGTNGITQIFFNYVDFIDSSVSVNAASKGNMVRDIWTYNGIFDPEYKENK